MDENEVRVFDTRYSAYGRNRWITGTSCGFGWVGTYGYRETGLFHMSHYVRARHYSYITGGWSTVDPLWPDEIAYGYVGGWTTRFADPSGLSVSCQCNPTVKVIGVNPKDKPKWKCYQNACIDYCKALDDAVVDARKDCEADGILGAPGNITNTLPCKKGSPYWEECGTRICVKGGIGFNGANANCSNYPKPVNQPIGEFYCLVECTMRTCCSRLQAEDPLKRMQKAAKKCKEKYG
jgi:RHS repeat-associated protein